MKKVFSLIVSFVLCILCYPANILPVVAEDGEYENRKNETLLELLNYASGQPKEDSVSPSGYFEESDILYMWYEESHPITIYNTGKFYRDRDSRPDYKTYTADGITEAYVETNAIVGNLFVVTNKSTFSYQKFFGDLLPFQHEITVYDGEIENIPFYMTIVPGFNEMCNGVVTTTDQYGSLLCYGTNGIEYETKAMGSNSYFGVDSYMMLEYYNYYGGRATGYTWDSVSDYECRVKESKIRWHRTSVWDSRMNTDMGRVYPNCIIPDMNTVLQVFNWLIKLNNDYPDKPDVNKAGWNITATMSYIMAKEPYYLQYEDSYGYELPRVKYIISDTEYIPDYMWYTETPSIDAEIYQFTGYKTLQYIEGSVLKTEKISYTVTVQQIGSFKISGAFPKKSDTVSGNPIVCVSYNDWWNTNTKTTCYLTTQDNYYEYGGRFLNEETNRWEKLTTIGGYAAYPQGRFITDIDNNNKLIFCNNENRLMEIPNEVKFTVDNYTFTIKIRDIADGKSEVTVTEGVEDISYNVSEYNPNSELVSEVARLKAELATAKETNKNLTQTIEYKDKIINTKEETIVALNSQIEHDSKLSNLCGDTDGDNRISISDSIILNRYLAGTVDSLPCSDPPPLAPEDEGSD